MWGSGGGLNGKHEYKIIVAILMPMFCIGNTRLHYIGLRATCAVTEVGDDAMVILELLTPDLGVSRTPTSGGQT